jgi:hypothetical protein
VPAFFAGLVAAIVSVYIAQMKPCRAPEFRQEEIEVTIGKIKIIKITPAQQASMS